MTLTINPGTTINPGVTLAQPLAPIVSSGLIFNIDATIPASYTEPSFGYASFSGSNYLETATPLPTITGDFTIEAFVYLTNDPDAGWPCVFSYQGSGGDWDQNSTGLTISSSRVSVPGVNNAIEYSSAVPLNTWSHIAVVRQSGTITVYINGQTVATVNNSDQLGGSGFNALIGAFDFYYGTSNPPRYFWNGNITNLRVVNGTALYTGSTITPPTKPLTAVSGTVLLMLTADRGHLLTDSSSSNYTINNNGGVVWSNINSNYTGTTWTDTVSSNNVTLANGVTYNSARNGYFDFVAASMQYGTANSLTINNAFTAESWSKISFTMDTSAGASIITENYGPSNLVPTLGFISESGQLQGGFWQNSNSGWQNVGTLQPMREVWYHTVVTWDGTNLVYYVNGVLDTSVTSDRTAIPSGTGLEIGRRWDNQSNPNAYWDGSIAAVRVYNRPLTSNEVLANYNSRKSNYVYNNHYFLPVQTGGTDNTTYTAWVPANDATAATIPVGATVIAQPANGLLGGIYTVTANLANGQGGNNSGYRWVTVTGLLGHAQSGVYVVGSNQPFDVFW